jgi:hypothetical protein
MKANLEPKAAQAQHEEYQVGASQTTDVEAELKPSPSH